MVNLSILPPVTSIFFDPTTDFGFKKLFGEDVNKDLLIDFLNSMLPLKTRFDKWCYFLKNLESLNSIPDILNGQIFMKAFNVATVAHMSTNDYILYQISKSKKYDLELIADEAEERGMEKGIEKGIEKTQMASVLAIYTKGFPAMEVSELLNLPLDKVVALIDKYERIIALYDKGLTAIAISSTLEIPFESVVEILDKYGQKSDN